MPTEFTKATEIAAFFASIVNGLPPDISDDGLLSRRDTFSKLFSFNEMLQTVRYKFQRRMEEGIYGPHMISKIENIEKSRIESFSRIQNYLKRISELNALNEAIGSDAQDANAQSENISETISGECVRAGSSADITILKEDDAASSTNEVRSESTAREVVNSEGKQDSSAQEKLNDGTLSMSFVELIALQGLESTLSRSSSYRIGRDLITKIAISLGFRQDAELKLSEVKAILSSIQLSKLGSSKNSVGWKRWVNLEAEAAFLLMDADANGKISFEEFCEFAIHHPLIFGPLVHIERLFSSYDGNRDGKIDEQELTDLLLEVHLESSDVEPNILVIQQNARAMLFANDPDKSRDLDFLEFAKLIFSNPELFGTATMLRSYFESADENHDGRLDKEEFSAMMKKFYKDNGAPLSSEEDFARMIDKLMEDADTDKDDHIDFTEFVSHFIRSESSFPLFHLLLNLFEDNGSGVREFNASLAVAQDPSKFSDIAYCSTCSAPLMGKFGIEKYGLTFCNSLCLSSHNDDVGFRAEYLRKYCGTGFRSLNHSDYAGVWSWASYHRLKKRKFGF